MASTNKDVSPDQWKLNGGVIRLRWWGSDDFQELPTAPAPNEPLSVGSGDTSWLRLQDAHGRVSRNHAVLSYESGRWKLVDANSTNGMLVDGARCDDVELDAGMEIWLGGVTLIAESSRSVALRSFLGRLLGWQPGRTRTVDLALRSIRLAATQRIALVLCGEEDLVLLARAIQHRVLGPEHPFIVCDPRRKRSSGNVRAAENYQSGMEALHAAKHGSLCIWHNRLPRDFAKMKAELANPDTRVRLVVCASGPSDAEAFGAVPITMPPLSSRVGDLPRIVEEYAYDITVELALPRRSFPRSDQEWVVQHAASSLPEIEKTIIRILQLRAAGGNLSAAAERLGMERWSLDKWVRRKDPPVPR